MGDNDNMIHHYTDGTHDQTGTYRSVPGAGKHPSARWLALHGWHDVADRPDPPAPTGYEWRPADPAYTLVGELSTPQGEWVAEPIEAVRARAIEANRATCRDRILAVWPEAKQRSAALGVYGAAGQAECADWIAANVQAENAAADSIAAADTAAAVAAVIPAWPEQGS